MMLTPLVLCWHTSVCHDIAKGSSFFEFLWFWPFWKWLNDFFKCTLPHKYTLLQKKCTLISSSSPNDPGSLTPTLGHKRSSFLEWPEVGGFRKLGWFAWARHSDKRVNISQMGHWSNFYVHWEKKWSQNDSTLEPFWKTVPPWRVEPFFPLIIMFRKRSEIFLHNFYGCDPKWFCAKF